MSATDDSPSIDHLLRHSDWLRALARRLCSDPASADDLAQETWLAALRHPRKPGLSVRAWLTTVGRRIARRQAALGGARHEADHLERRALDASATDDVIARIEQERRLRACG